MKRVIRYGRKSPNGWDDEGETEAMQDERTRAYCVANGLAPIGPMMFDMFESSATLNRPKLQEALRMIRAGEADGIVVFRLDRLTRSIKDLLALVADVFAPGKAELHSVNEKVDTSGATGRLLLTLLGAINQWQREVIQENVRETLATKRASGAYLGGVPYGWKRVENPDDIDKKTGKPKLTKLVPVEGEQRVITSIRQLLVCDNVAGYRWTHDAIAAELNQRRYPTRDGKPWTRSRVQRALASPEVSA